MFFFKINLANEQELYFMILLKSQFCEMSQVCPNGPLRVKTQISPEWNRPWTWGRERESSAWMNTHPLAHYHQSSCTLWPARERGREGGREGWREGGREGGGGEHDFNSITTNKEKQTMHGRNEVVVLMPVWPTCNMVCLVWSKQPNLWPNYTGYLKVVIGVCPCTQFFHLLKIFTQKIFTRF